MGPDEPNDGGPFEPDPDRDEQIVTALRVHYLQRPDPATVADHHRVLQRAQRVRRARLGYRASAGTIVAVAAVLLVAVMGAGLLQPSVETINVTGAAGPGEPDEVPASEGAADDGTPSDREMLVAEVREPDAPTSDAPGLATAPGGPTTSAAGRPDQDGRSAELGTDEPGTAAVSSTATTVASTAGHGQGTTVGGGSPTRRAATTTTTAETTTSREDTTARETSTTQATTTSTTQATTTSTTSTVASTTTTTSAPTTSTTGGQAVTCFGLVATIVGTDADDVLLGTSGPDVIVGLAGKDTIRGLGGDDVLCGGNGKDLLDGGSGDDRLNGQNGPDHLIGGSGFDEFVTGPGDTTEDGPN